MKLSESQAKQIIKTPKNKSELSLGRDYENNLKILTESIFEPTLVNIKAYKDYMGRLSTILSGKKFDRLQSFIQYPLPVVDISETALKEIYRVFEAKNTFFSHSLTNSESTVRFNKIIDSLQVQDWIKTKGKEVLKNKPNSICLIEKDENGNPYLVLIDSNRLLDFELSDDGVQLEYLSFLHSEEIINEKKVVRISVYDDQFYRVFVKIGSGDYTLESENKHLANICPARMFMTDNLNSTGDFNKRVPLSSSIAKLFEWTTFNTYKYYVDHYAPFPVTERVEDSCEDDYCSNGTVTKEVEYIQGGETMYKTESKTCQICSNKSIIGPGTEIQIQARQDKDDVASDGIFRMISPETNNLDYVKDKLTDLEQYIVLKTAGLNTILGKEAINEVQVKGSFESRLTILLEIKGNFDKLYKWIIKTSAQLIYGENVGISVDANFGTEFYLMTEEDIQERFKTAKEIGMPESELDMLYSQLNNTKYRGNPDKMSRLDIIKQLDPLPYDDIETCLRKHEKGIITDNELVIKGRMTNFVNKFERENGSITEFGSDLEDLNRINNIIEIFNKYANEYEIKTEVSEAKQIGSSETGD